GACVGVRALRGRNRRFAPNRQRQHHSGKQHKLPHRQENHAVRRQRRVGLVLFDWFALSMLCHGAARSPLLRGEVEHQAAVHEGGAVHLPAFAGQPNPALEAAVRDSHAIDRGAVHAGGQLPHAGDAQHAALDRNLDVLRFDTGQRCDDSELLLALEHIDRGLPIHRRCRREAGPEELAMQLLRPLDHCAGLGPHPTSRICCGHCRPPLATGSPRPSLRYWHAFHQVRDPRAEAWPLHVVVRRGAEATDGGPFARAAETVYRRPAFRRGANGLCLVIIFTSPTAEKASIVQKEWTCRATLRRVRRRWCWRANSGTARWRRGAIGRDGSSAWWTSTGTRWTRCRSPTCWTSRGRS